MSSADPNLLWGLLQGLIPALLAIRIVPALETKGAGYFAHPPVPIVAADVLPQRFEDFAIVLPVLFAEFRIGDSGVQERLVPP